MLTFWVTFKDLFCIVRFLWGFLQRMTDSDYKICNFDFFEFFKTVRHLNF
jgi:hypothetical protein